MEKETRQDGDKQKSELKRSGTHAHIITRPYKLVESCSSKWWDFEKFSFSRDTDSSGVDEDDDNFHFERLWSILNMRNTCMYDIYMEKAMAPHCSTFAAWEIPWTEEPGRLQSMRWWRVRHNWATSLSLFIFMHWRRKWQPTPVFLPGESQGRGSLVGCHLWGHTESDTTEATQQHDIYTYVWMYIYIYIHLWLSSVLIRLFLGIKVKNTVPENHFWRLWLSAKYTPSMRKFSMP